MSGIVSTGGPSTRSGRTAFFYGPFDKLRANGIPLRPSHGNIPFVVSLSNHERNRLDRRPFDKLRANGIFLRPSDGDIPFVVSLSNHERNRLDRRPFDKLRANGIFPWALRQARGERHF